MRNNKQYTAKQIREAIAYWQNQLKMMTEEVSDFDDPLHYGKHKQVNPSSWHGIKNLLTVGEVLEAMENAFGHQQNAILNFGPSGKIYG